MPIAYGKDQIFLAWQGTNEHLYVASSTDGNAFDNKHQLAEQSLRSTRPAIAYGKGLLFLAWIDHEDHVNIISSPDGLYWSNKRTLPETSERKCPPALAFLHDRLYLAWTGRGHKNHIDITSFTVADDGELAEFGKITLDEESTDEAGPTMTATDDDLYLSWLGRDGHVNVVKSHNGKTFQNKCTLHERSHHTSTPGIVYGNGYLYLSWIGTDDKLNMITSADGTTWSNKTMLEEKSTSTGVTGVTFGNGTLYLDWSGTDRKHHINVMTFKIEGTDGTIPKGQLVTLEDEAEK
ncbi:MAG: hypothetical protein ABI234_05890 [Ktedonobacteraceae bacterium]